MGATEAGHWYDLEGKPAYEVKKAKGDGMRPTTVRDARKMGLVPSVTTILKVLAKPGLERWKQTNILHSALTLPMIDGESLDDYAKRVERDAAEQAKQAAERGTRIHASIECAFLGLPYEEQDIPFVKATFEAIDRILPYEYWRAERSFSHPLGYGGKCDLHSLEGVVVDFKTKEFSSGDKISGFDEQAMQLAAYREGFGMSQAEGVNIYISVTEPGLVVAKHWDPEELDRGWEMFKHAFALWKLQKNYDPAEAFRRAA